MEEVDFLVIGSGSGLDVASAAANREQSVAVVEKGPLGGTCLNRGCIPSKMLLYHADVLETVERADEFHIDASVNDVAFADIVEEVNDEVQSDAESIRRGLRSSSHHDLYEGEGRFVDERTVEVVEGADDGARIRAETVLVAAGTRPSIPDIDGIDDVDYLTSTDALQLTSPPDHLIIVGGGYIAAELGHFFGTFGSEITIVVRTTVVTTTPWPTNAVVGVVPGSFVVTTVAVGYALAVGIAFRPREWMGHPELRSQDVGRWRED